MGSVLGAVTGAGAIAGAASNLFGGGKGGGTSESENKNISQTNQNTLGAESGATEAARNIGKDQLQALSNNVSDLVNKSGRDSGEIDNMFKQLLTNFSTGTSQPTPQQLQQATQYVDQTFTVPAQQQYGKFLDQAATLQDERAAARGRVSSDTAYQREFAGQANQAAQDLTNQRGSLIAQRTDYLSNQLPQQQLAAALQGSQYFNNTMNSALSNRLNLLNASTQQQQLGLQRQIASGGSNLTQNTLGGKNNSGAQTSFGTGLTSLAGIADSASPAIGKGIGAVGGFIGGETAPTSGWGGTTYDSNHDDLGNTIRGGTAGGRTYQN